jgi:hypothetical protein
MTEGLLEGVVDKAPLLKQKRSGRHAAGNTGRHRISHTQEPGIHKGNDADHTISRWWGDRGVARSWSEGEGVNPRTRFAIQDTLAKSHFYHGLTSDSTLLDLGVGAKTYLTPDLVPQGAHVIAADKSPEMLSELQKNFSNFYEGFVETDARNLQFPPDQFNRIASTLMMRYLSVEEQQQAVLEMIRTAKPGAQIHIIDFDNIEGYPHQKATFDPDRLLVDFQMSNFQNRLQALGKRIERASATEIPRDFDGAKGHLHYMTLAVGD